MKLKQIIFLILFILSFILSVIFNFHRINVPYFGGLYKGVWVDVIYKENKDLKLVDIEKPLNTLKINENHYLYKTKGFYKVNKINISNPDKIKQIILYIDKRAQFSDFDKIDNSKNILDKFSVIVLSFFYNFHLYLFSYIFLFLFLYNFKGRIGFKYCFWAIFALCIIFRLTQLNSIPFWDDEVYVLRVTAPYSQLSELFSDPGNPPLYFILFKIYRTIVQNPMFYRFSSVILGSVFCVVFYLYIKKLLNLRFALVGLFFAGFNIALVYLSQELRCYTLLMILSVLTSYFLFKKHKTGYLITSIMLLYTHFYGAFYYLFNFIFSVSYFRKKKTFIILNLIAGLSFLPCLIFKMLSLTESFNSWLKPPQISDFARMINMLCGPVLIFIIFIALVIFLYQKASKRKKLFILYNSSAIIFVVLSAAFFSYFVKPLFLYRYFWVIYPCYLALCVCIARDIKLNILIFLSFISFGVLNYQNLYCNHNLYLDFIKNNLDKSKTNYVFMTDTVEGYREFLNDSIKPVYIQINTGINTINPLEYGIKIPSDCWVLNLYLDEKTYTEAKSIELYKTPLGVFSRIEY